MDTEYTNKSSTGSIVLRAAIAAAALTITGIGLTACNTTEGLGRDVEAAGDAIADTAEDASD